MTTGLELATPAVFGELAHGGLVAYRWRSMLGWIRAAKPAAELLTLLTLRNSQLRAALTQHGRSSLARIPQPGICGYGTMACSVQVEYRADRSLLELEDRIAPQRRLDDARSSQEV